MAMLSLRGQTARVSELDPSGNDVPTVGGLPIHLPTGVSFVSIEPAGSGPTIRLSDDEIDRQFAALGYPANIPVGADPHQKRYAVRFSRDNLLQALLVDPLLADTGLPTAIPGFTKEILLLVMANQARGSDDDVVERSDGQGTWRRGDVRQPGKYGFEERFDPDDPIRAEYPLFGWPIYFGGIDVTPLAGMLTSRLLLQEPSFASCAFVQRDNDPNADLGYVEYPEVTVFDSLVRAAKYVLSNREEYGLIATPPSINYAWGNRNDSASTPRTWSGGLPSGVVAHTEVQAFAADFLWTFADVLAQYDDFSLQGLLSVAQLPDRPGFIERLRTAAKSLEESLTDFYASKPAIGEYLIAGKYFSSGKWHALDTLSGTATGVAITSVLSQDDRFNQALVTMVGANAGLLCRYGLRDLSTHDPTFHPWTQPSVCLPFQTVLAAFGMHRRGFVDIASDLVSRTHDGLSHPAIAGTRPEFLAVNMTDEIEQIDVVLSARREVDYGEAFVFNYIQPPMAFHGWTHRAYEAAVAYLHGHST